MSEIDQQFIEYVVKSLVGKPDAVHIDRRIDEKGVLLELTVDPEDLGRVIGKRGATAQSLRTLLRALGTKNDARYNLKIIDNGPAGGPPAAAPVSNAGFADIQSTTGPSSDTSDDRADDANDEVTPKLGDQPRTENAPSREDGTSDRLRQTRAELADLDDLDV
jgi:uncharacterized protein